MNSMQAIEKVLYVSAGDFYCDVSGCLIRTTLGSCVAVCAWNSKLKLSAMVHYLLPYKSNKYSSKGDDYFADKVLPKLLITLKQYGAIEDFKFYAYGGGSLLGKGSERSRIGGQNILYLKKWAKENNITFLRTSLGGECCRSVTLNGFNGEILLRETI